jgi:hypothetical protein
MELVANSLYQLLAKDVQSYCEKAHYEDAKVYDLYKKLRSLEAHKIFSAVLTG